MRAGVLGECPRGQRREHVRARPGTAEQPEHSATAARPAPTTRAGDAVRNDADRPARCGGEHQGCDEDDRRGAEERRGERDRAESGDDDVDQWRVAAGADRDERGAHHDVADRAGGEDEADRAGRHSVVVQAARDQQLGHPAERTGDDERPRARDHPPVSQQPHHRDPRCALAIGRAHPVRAARRAGRQHQRDRHRPRQEGDERERHCPRGARHEQAAESRADHGSHRGDDDRRPDAARASELGQPRGSGGPQHAERHAVHRSTDEERAQSAAATEQAAGDEQHTGRDRHQASAEPVGEHPRGHRGGDRRECGQREHERRP